MIPSKIPRGHVIAVLLFLTWNVSFTASINQYNNNDISRSLYLASASHPKMGGGWRPIMSADTIAAYGFGAPGGAAHTTVRQKLLTGPALIETKVVSPHVVSVSPWSDHIFASSTSTRPLVTRDANKMTAYRTTSSMFPPSGAMLNSPVHSYANPFAMHSNQFDVFVKHPMPQQHQQQQQRPVVYKGAAAAQMMKHLNAQKHHQSAMLQFAAAANNYNHFNNYHHGHPQSLQQAYQTSMKAPPMQRPIDTYKRPAVEGFAARPTGPGAPPSSSHTFYGNSNFNNNNNNNFNDNNIKNNNNNNNANFQKVNPHESLLTQTKTKVTPAQNVAAVTYKPPFNAHFQQFGIQEEPFGPIPSSILGSFSSFGHASVKARDQVPANKPIPLTSTTTTKAPTTSTQAFTPAPSTYSTIANNYAAQESAHKNANKQKNVKQNVRGSNDDYTKNLVPPPIVTSFDPFPSRPQEGTKMSSMKGNFIPSPPDPLSKHQNAPEIKPMSSGTKQSNTYMYNTNLGTKRPEVTSFFDPLPSTAAPLDAQSTNAVPDKLLAQLPSPYTPPANSFHAQPPVKFDETGIKENYQIHHSKTPVKYNDDFKYFAPTRGQELFSGSKYVKHNNNYEANTKIPNKGSYEVTENWGSSGEYNTQPTLHTWLNKPAQSYKQYNIDLKPPPLPYKIPLSHDDRLFPVSFPPAYKAPSVLISQIPTTQSSLTDEENKKHKTFYSQLENTLASLDDFHQEVGDEAHDLATPFNITYEDDRSQDRPTTTIYDDIFVSPKKKPSKINKVQIETTTISIFEDDAKELTTKYETTKDTHEVVESDPQINELPTIPPNKHFKRPLLTTPVPIESWENRLKNRNKNRRRRPTKLSTTTEEPIRETAEYTDHPIRSSKFRTTTQPSAESVEVSTKGRERTRARLPHHRLRFTTKPTSQPELTSSAQPTILPTAPVTLRPKFHGRIKSTTLSSLDFEDLIDTTTPRDVKAPEVSFKQSSIMKIAKDNHVNRHHSTRPHSNSYESFNETPDYSHKQDEKDTPTSDIFINTYEHKYSSQKLQNENTGIGDLATAELNVDASQKNSKTTSSEQIFTEQKLGNRGNTKLGFNKNDQQGDSAEDTISTTPVNPVKTHRLKLKPNKYDSNRPRFSVKDYRNRLNQLSTSTDKPSTTSESSLNRLRFPNRSRFPSYKDQHTDSKPIGTEVSTSTEFPRKKFTPKDPRHKDANHEENAENDDKLENVKISPSEQNENEISKKPIIKLRNNLRRDPNRTRGTTTAIPPTSTSTEAAASEDTEEASVKPINTYTNLKRPTVSIIRKKANTTEEVVPENVSTSTEVVVTVDEKVEVSTERHTSETAIMKIAKDERKNASGEDSSENMSMDQSQRVSDLTMASSKDSAPGLFKSVSPNSRKVPNYFTIATDDPILPIEAFFPQLNQKKES